MKGSVVERVDYRLPKNFLAFEKYDSTQRKGEHQEQFEETDEIDLVLKIKETRLCKNGLEL